MKLRRTMATLGVAGALFGSGLIGAGSADALGGASPQALPPHWAQLYISYAGNGNYLVVVDGHTTAGSAPVGIRVYGDDEWFDDFLFGVGGYNRTDPDGNFNVSRTVHGSVLNEDWGQDEIYAIVDVGISIRTNTIRRSF